MNVDLLNVDFKNMVANDKSVLSLFTDEKDEKINPTYYNKKTSLECIDSMIIAFGKEAVINYCVICAYKYVWRCENKDNFKEDLRKAQWYLNKALELSTGELSFLSIMQQANEISCIINQMIEQRKKENEEA